MEDVTKLVARQYEDYSYPPPAQDLAERVARGDFQLGDPSLFAPVIWPEGRSRELLRILVAGCGTQQAAWFAFTNPTCRVFGIDLSEASLAHQRYLQDRHQLANLRLFKGDLREVGGIGRDFDLVVCTGVLHHMSDPGEGVRALADVLAPHGAISGMVYAALWRSGVYMLQDVFRRLGVKQDQEGVAFVRSTLAQLPKWHLLHWYLATTSELKHDAAIVDTFLHPQDRAYTVPQVLELVETNGLHFQGWFENSLYYPDAVYPPDNDLAQRIAAAPERDQWAATEAIVLLNGNHDFIARKQPARPISFKAGLNELYPHNATGLHKLGPLRYFRGRGEFNLSTMESALLDGIDGARTIGALIGALGADEAAAHAFFERAWKQGHLMLARAPASVYASSSTSQ